MVDDGKLIWIDYDAWFEDSDGEKKIFDTTHEEVAKENDMYQEGMNYSPLPMIAGEGEIVKGLEEAISETEPGEEKKVEIEPEDGFGERDPTIVKVIPLNKLLKAPQFQQENAEPPQVGMDVEFNGKVGTIIQMTASRARLDFNHKLAGKKLIYDFKIEKVAETNEEIIEGVLGIHYGMPEKFDIDLVSDEEVNIKIPDMAKVDHNWFQKKYYVIALIRSKIEELKTIRFFEEYVKKSKEDSDEGDEDKQDDESSNENDDKNEEDDKEEDIDEDKEE